MFTTDGFAIFDAFMKYLFKLSGEDTKKSLEKMQITKFIIIIILIFIFVSQQYVKSQVKI